jgi:hypothetical protein
MDNSTKSRLAIDLDALEAQLKNVHHQQPARRPRNNDPLAELARIVGQDDPYRAILANERVEAPAEESALATASARKRRREPDLFGDTRPASQLVAEAQSHEAAANDDRQQQLAAAEEAATAALSRNAAAARLPPAEFEATLRGILGERRQPGSPADRADNHGGAPSADGSAHMAEDDQYADQAETTAEEEGDYPAEEEEPEERRSRKGLVAAAALLAVGAIGVGGFYFARGSSVRTASGEPPVIMAEKQPTKVQAKGSEEAASPNKQIYETVKQAQEQGTKVVNRDEQPVDLNQALRRDGPTASLPSGQRGISLPQPPQASNLGGRQDEPRKVKTVAVRPDGSIVSEGQPADPVLSRGVAPALQSRPLLSQGQAAEPAQSQSQPQGQVQLPPLRQGSSQVTPSVANNGGKQQTGVGESSDKTDSRAEARANASLGISPVGNGQQPAEQAQAPSQPPSQPPAQARVQSQPQSQPQAEAKPQQRAAVQPPAQSQSRSQPQQQPQPQAQLARRVAAAPAEQAATSRAAGASSEAGFVVQLAAPGSEQEARETFASLQRKHASELGGRQPIIRQAQVSGRTIWRLRVGASSREEATTLCNKLQASGGACFVAKN